MAFTTIDDPEAYFQVMEFTGNETARALTLPGDTDMQPDLVMLKDVGSTDENSWRVADSGRGVASKWLATDNADAEGTSSSVVTALSSDGFSVGAAAAANSSGNSMISYSWKESATAGFDIVSYTGNGSARTISHSTGGTKPLGLILCKSRGTNDNWATYHKGLDGNYNLTLDTNEAKIDSNTPWNDTDATSSVFSVLSSGRTNGSSQTYIAYCWAPVKGFSKFSVYEGNSNSNGSFIWTGFTPAMVVVKCHTHTGNWMITDHVRSRKNNSNYNNWQLRWDTNAADENGTVGVDFLSNGFKWRDSENSANATSRNYVFMAFARSPFVNSEGVAATATVGTGKA